MHITLAACIKYDQSLAIVIIIYSDTPFMLLTTTTTTLWTLSDPEVGLWRHLLDKTLRDLIGYER